MKIKWYLFFLVILIVSFVFYNLFDASKTVPTRVGVLMIGDSRYEKLEGLQKGVQDLGYHKGDIQFIVKNSQESQEKLETQIPELIHEYPDIIVTCGAIETTELKKYMDKNNIKIPVVFAGISSPKEIGLIKNYNKPQGLFTGINNDEAALSGKRLEILHDLIPSIKRIHILYDKKIEISKLSLQGTLEAAHRLSIPVKEWDVDDPLFLQKLNTDLKNDDGLLLLPGFSIESMTGKLAVMSKRMGLPVMGIYEHEAKMGILASYGASFEEQGYQSARFVSLIMKGNKPGDLPVELPDGIRFIINKNQQAVLGKRINQELLYIAEFVGTDAHLGSDDE